MDVSAKGNPVESNGKSKRAKEKANGGMRNKKKCIMIVRARQREKGDRVAESFQKGKK